MKQHQGTRASRRSTNKLFNGVLPTKSGWACVWNLVNLSTRCFMRKEDRFGDVLIKKTGLPLLFSAAIIVVPSLVDSRITPMLFATICFFVMSYIIIFTRAVWPVGGGMKQALNALLPLITIASCCYDLNQKSLLLPSHLSTVILYLDASLVYQCRSQPLVIFPVVLLYLSLQTMESGVRYGLYDWIGGGSIDVCECANPPCARGVINAIAEFGWLALLLLGDFYLTRGFCHGLDAQIRKMRSTVKVSGAVAERLARYDVDEAQEKIEWAKEKKELPQEMANSFLQLVENLRSYKAYLPQSCLVSDTEEDEDTTLHRDSSPTSEISTHSGLVNEMVKAQSDSETSSVGRQESGISVVKKAAPRRVRASLVCGNCVGYLSRHEDLTDTAHTEWMSNDVEEWCASVQGVKGVVDLLWGDRRYASFNARQTCSDHAAAGIDVLSSRQERQGEWSGCVVTGQTVCGDFGSSGMLRFMILGRSAGALQPLERLAAQWKVPVLADAEAYNAACFLWDGLLLGAVLLKKKGPVPFRVYRMESRRSGGEQGTEWMYELASLGMLNSATQSDSREKHMKLIISRLPPCPAPP
eukprot:Hpha_TRINITY_DN11013_c0_g2::TRINITY_DN11013_c0_g2_i1::g.92697::m.92697